MIQQRLQSKTMNKIIFKTFTVFIFLLCALHSRSQNSLQFQWGFTPLSTNISTEYQQKNNFSIGMLHSMEHSPFSFGITYHHQQFESKSAINNQNQFTIYNYLLSGRYDFFSIEMLQMYAAIDLGMYQMKISEIKNGITNNNYHSGFSGNIAAGIDLKIMKRVTLGLNIQNQHFLNTNIPLHNNEVVHDLNSLGGNVSLRFLFKK